MELGSTFLSEKGNIGAKRQTCMSSLMWKLKSFISEIEDCRIMTISYWEEQHGKQ